MKTVQDYLDEYGWEISESGGGCRWAILPRRYGFIALTDEGGCDVPSDIHEPIMVGMYRLDGSQIGDVHTFPSGICGFNFKMLQED